MTVLLDYSEICPAKLSSRRHHFVLPRTWPAKGPKRFAGVAPALDAMAGCGRFMDLVVALMSDTFWYTDSYKAAVAKAVDAAVAGAHGADGPWATLQRSRVFHASVILAKQVLRFTYDLKSAAMLTQRIADALAFGRAVGRVAVNNAILAAGPADPVAVENDDFEHFSGSLDHDGATSITVWQALRAMVLERVMVAYDEAVGAGPNGDQWPAASVAHSLDAAEQQSFLDTGAYYTDLTGRLLRSAACITAAIQRVHIDVLKHQTSMPEMAPGFKRSCAAASAKPDEDAKAAVKGPKAAKVAAKAAKCSAKAAAKTAKEPIWRSYIFDLAAMWMTLKNVFLAVTRSDARAMIHVLGQSRLWSITTGLAGSTAAVSALEPRQIERFALIGRLAAALHSIYLRLWTAGMMLLNVKVQGSQMAIKRALARVSNSVFIRADEDIKCDSPNCGTATLLDNHWTFTALTNEQAGLATDIVVGPGAERPDLHHSFYAGHIAMAITQSSPHMWAAMTKYSLWFSDNLISGLPEYSDITARYDWWSRPEVNGWTLDLNGLQHVYVDYKQTYWRGREAEEAAEIDAIMAKVGL